jgi:hypothetical protein
MAVHQYRLTCRGMLRPQVIVELFRRGIYWARGGPTPLDTQRRRHHLRIRAETESQAIKQARSEIERAGASAREISEVRIVGSD